MHAECVWSPEVLEIYNAVSDVLVCAGWCEVGRPRRHNAERHFIPPCTMVCGRGTRILSSRVPMFLHVACFAPLLLEKKKIFFVSGHRSTHTIISAPGYCDPVFNDKAWLYSPMSELRGQGPFSKTPLSRSHSYQCTRQSIVVFVTNP